MQFLLSVCWLAAILYSTIPSFWLLIHPFAAFWRQRKRSPFRVLLPLWLLIMITVAAVTWPWLGERFYTTPLAWIVALAPFAAGISIYKRTGRSFGRQNLMGEAELRLPEQALVKTGMHGRMRHPFYLAHFCMLLGWTIGGGLIVNYVLTLYALLTGALMIFLEDRELEQRFGEEYRVYRKSVPAFLPRRGPRAL